MHTAPQDRVDEGSARLPSLHCKSIAERVRKQIFGNASKNRMSNACSAMRTKGEELRIQLAYLLSDDLLYVAVSQYRVKPRGIAF